MRQWINICENAQTDLSAEELIERFPGIETDLAFVADWMHGAECLYRFVVEPMSKYKDFAEHLLSTYPEFPKDKARTMKIVRELKGGAPQRPIFSEAKAFGDEQAFVMEGRHRIVAFLLAGYETVPVVYVSRQT